MRNEINRYTVPGFNAYTAIDLGFSFGAALKTFIAPTGKIKSFGNNQARPAYNFDTKLGQYQAIGESGSALNSVLSTEDK